MKMRNNQIKIKVSEIFINKILNI